MKTIKAITAGVLSMVMMISMLGAGLVSVSASSLEPTSGTVFDTIWVDYLMKDGAADNKTFFLECDSNPGFWDYKTYRDNGWWDANKNKASYCLQHQAELPNGTSYDSHEGEASLERMSEESKDALQYILKNGYPAAECYWAAHGVSDPAAQGVATQMAVWLVLEEIGEVSMNSGMLSDWNRGAYTLNPDSSMADYESYSGMIDMINTLVDAGLNGSNPAQPSITVTPVDNFIKDGKFNLEYKVHAEYTPKGYDYSFSELPAGYKTLWWDGSSYIEYDAASENWHSTLTYGDNYYILSFPVTMDNLKKTITLTVQFDVPDVSPGKIYYYETSNLHTSGWKYQDIIRLVEATLDGNDDKTNQTTAGVSSLTVEITKLDDTTKKPLAGAEFGLYSDSACTLPVKKSGQPVVLITGVDGKAKAEGLDNTEMYLKETKAPAGYALSNTVYPVKDFETALDTTTLVLKASKTITNKQQLARLEITKEGEVLTGYNETTGFEYTKKLVAGAQYGMYSDLACTNLLQVLTTGEAAVKSELYELGDYYLKEIHAPAGFLLDDTVHKVTLKSGDSGSNTESVTFDEPRAGLLLTTEKKDELTRKPLSGAKFGMYNKNAIYSQNGTLLVKADSLLETMITDENGTVTTKIDYPHGLYYIKELEAPAGYVLSDEIQEVDFRYSSENTLKTIKLSREFFNTPQEGNIYISKKGEVLTGFNKSSGFVYEERLVGGARYGFYKDAACTELVDTVVTKETGPASTKELPLGTYYYKELEAPDGLMLDTTVYSVTLDYAGQDVEVTSKTVAVADDRAKLNLSIEKIDGDGKRLSGAKLGIYANQTIKTYDGTLLFNKGELIETMITETDGSARNSMDYPHGEFYLKEIEAPKGYVLSDEIQEIDFRYNSENTLPVIYMTKTVENHAQMGIINVFKEGEVLTAYNSTDGFIYEKRFIGGARYGFYKDAACTELVDTIVTKETGPASTKELPLGTYYYKELEAPEGFLLDKTVYSVTLEYAGQEVQAASANVTVQDERAKLSISIYKYEEGDKKTGLSDAQFSFTAAEDIYNFAGEQIVKKGTLLDMATSGLDGLALSHMDYPACRILVEEIKAPAGYELNKEQFFVDLKHTGENQEILLTVSNPPMLGWIVMNYDNVFSSFPSPNTGDFGRLLMAALISIMTVSGLAVWVAFPRRKRRKIKIRCMTALIIISSLIHMNALNVLAADEEPETKVVESLYTADVPEAETEFSQIIEAEGNKYRLKNVTYQEKERLKTDILTETTGVYYDEAGDFPLEKESKGIIYHLTSTKEQQNILDDRLHKESMTVTFNDCISQADIPETYEMTMLDELSGEQVKGSGNLNNVKSIKEEWRADFNVDLTFYQVDSRYIMFGGERITVSEAAPGIKAEQFSQILENLRLPAASYRLNEIVWTSEPYVDDNGILCRNAQARGERYLHQYECTYEMEYRLPDVTERQYMLTYTGSIKDTPGYSITATAIYEKVHEDNMVIFYIVLALIILAAILIIFFVAKKLKFKKAREG